MVFVAAFFATPVFSQIQKGDVSTNLSGSISGGYTSDFGNQTPSDHTFTAAGYADLTGSFYDPNFLSFDVQPYYNESRANSDFQSIISASGVNASAGIFGGSSFPGSISYSKTFSSSGNFGVPNLANYTTHGDSDTLNVAWSEHLPDVPLLSVSYLQGSSESSLYGATSNVDTAFRGFNANSSYNLAGFLLTGGFHYLDNHTELPEIIGETTESTSHSEDYTYNFGIGHPLPFNGSFSAAASRSDVNADYTGGNYDETLDNITVGLNFNPLDQLHVGSNAQYTDNLLGTLYQSVVTSGGILPSSIPEQTSHSLDVTSYGNYQFTSLHLTVDGTEEYRDQTFLGEGFTSNAYTGGGSYSNQFYGGNLNATASIITTNTSASNSSRLGFTTLINYIRPVGRWLLSGSGSYARNVETLLITYTSDSYSYSGSVSRKFHQRSNWSFIASGSKASLDEQGGSSSFTQSYSTAASFRRISGSASYSKSDGNAILTSSGLATTSLLLSALVPTATVAYGGSAYAGSIGATPIRGLTLSCSYSSATSNTAADSEASRNRTELLYGRVQYLLRKVYLQAGYERLSQSFSISGSGPVTMSTVYVGISRWFNFF